MNEYDLFRNYQISVKIFNNFLFLRKDLYFRRYTAVEFSISHEIIIYKGGFERKADECQPRENIDEAGLLND